MRCFFLFLFFFINSLFSDSNMKQARFFITEWKKKKEEKEATALVAFICYTITDLFGARRG